MSEVIGKRVLSKADEVRLFKLNRQKHDALAAFEQSQEETKSKKKAWELSEEDFDKFLAEVEAGPVLPFGNEDDDEEDEDEDKPVAATGPSDYIDVEFQKALPGPKNQTDFDPSWKLITFEELGFSEGMIEALATEKLTNLGELAYWQSRWNHELTTINGITQKRADEIDRIMMEFWATWKPKTVASSPPLDVPGVDNSDPEDPKPSEKPKRSRKPKPKQPETSESEPEAEDESQEPGPEEGPSDEPSED